MTTPARQVWLFELGCWCALATAVLHVGAHLYVPLADGAIAAGTPAPHVIQVPGLLHPDARSTLNGFSLSIAILLASIGAAGLAVVRYAGDVAPLLRRVAGAFALGTTGVLALSILQFFGLLSFPLVIVALCFALACVPEN
jgi:hypothetical protein